jgi:aldose 1-epimerase
MLLTIGLAAALAAEGTKMTATDFGKLPDGTPTKLLTLTNAHGMTLKLTDYGARIVAIEAPDRAGKLANVVLTRPDAKAYAEHGAFFGCTTGRFANRIAKGKFTLDGKEHQLAVNGTHHLHGGKAGFDRKVWSIAKSDAGSVAFSMTSPDGDENYPGAMTVVVIFELTDSDEVAIHYQATTTKPTILNLTNHAYFNLAGAGQGDVLAHRMEILADRFVAADGELIPTGKLEAVQGTPLDFTTARTLGERIEKLKVGPGNPGGTAQYVAVVVAAGTLRTAAKVVDPQSGRTMEVLTTEPGVQLYTGNFLDGGAVNGNYAKHGAFCLECQHFPDSPNRPEFPSTVLRPGETYRQTTIHRFSVTK